MLFDGHHQFEEIGTVHDPPIGILKNPRLVSRVTKSVAQVVAEHAAKGHVPVTLGGDHSLVRFGPVEWCIGFDPHLYRQWEQFQGHSRMLNVLFSRNCLTPLWFYAIRKYPDACVIWIDAHADINTVESTESGTSFGWLELLFWADIRARKYPRNAGVIPSRYWVESGRIFLG